ncbi:MAG: TetR/AcrR family transcriptional regulator [Chloroflexaceae bacterium]
MVQDLEPISSPTAVKIVDAASHLFMQRGYKAVSINDIIRAADVTKPTLYYYFADKEELFVQMGLRVLQNLGARLAAAAGAPGGTFARLRALAAVLMDDHERDMRMMRHEMVEYLGPANRNRLARAFFTHLFRPILGVMEQGVAEGALGHYPPLTLANLFLSMSESCQEFAGQSRMAAWAADSGIPVQIGSISTQEMVDLFLYGVAASGSRGAPPAADTHGGV